MQQSYELDPGLIVQKKEAKPGEGGIAQSVSIEKLDNLSIQSISTNIAASENLFEGSIPVDGIENWLNSVENYQKILVTPPSGDIGTAAALEPESSPQIETFTEEKVFSPMEKGDENIERIPIIQDKDVSDQNESGESEFIPAQIIETVTPGFVVTDLQVQPPDRVPSNDQSEETTVLPELIPVEGEEVGIEAASDGVSTSAENRHSREPVLRRSKLRQFEK